MADKLSPELDRRIISMLAEGYTHREIAAACDVSVSTVSRLRGSGRGETPSGIQAEFIALQDAAETLDQLRYVFEVARTMAENGYDVSEYRCLPLLMQLLPPGEHREERAEIYAFHRSHCLP